MRTNMYLLNLDNRWISIALLSFTVDTIVSIPRLPKDAPFPLSISTNYYSIHGTVSYSTVTLNRKCAINLIISSLTLPGISP